MTLLTKEQILSANDRDTKTINVPKWGGDVIISVMSSKAKDAFEASILDGKGNTNLKNVRAKLVAACIVDETGKLMFSESDIEKLGEKSAVSLDLIYMECLKLNKVGDEEIEELAKN